MSPTTTSRPLSEIVSSPRSVKALADAGYSTLADLEDVSAETIAAINGVGPATLAELQTAWAPEPTTIDFSAVEEGPHPILLSSPYAGLSVRLHEATEERDGKRVRVKLPAFLAFEKGEAKFTKASFAMVKHPHDKPAQRDFVNGDAPWRVEAHQWLRESSSFKAGRFIILD